MAREGVKWWTQPYQKAVSYLLDKDVVTREEFDAIEDWAKIRAFTVTGINKLDVLQQILENLVETVNGGGTLNDFQDDLGDILDSAGLDQLSPWRAETIFRTNIQSAYGRGAWEEGTDPDIADNIWGWKYWTVGDDRVRDEHDALQGLAFATGDGDEFFPPWDFNCRCHAEWITVAEAQDEGLESADAPEEAQNALKDSDFVSPAISDEYDPDIEDYHPAAVMEFEKDMGDA